MEQAEMIELEVSLRNLERHLFADKTMFPVWMRLKEAREMVGEHIRGLQPK